eukprot:4882762-Pyramimonas_sp.AAC.1
MPSRLPSEPPFRRLESNGLGNRSWAPWGPCQQNAGQGLRVTSWNARGLLCLDTRKRESKIQLRSEYMRQRFLIVLREVRGDERRLLHIIDDTPYSYTSYLSVSDASAGGIVFLVPGHSPHLPAPDALKPECVLHPIVTGRAAALFISSPTHDHSMCVLNIQNYSLSAPEVHEIECSWAQQVARAQQHESTFKFVAFGGLLQIS